MTGNTGNSAMMIPNQNVDDFKIAFSFDGFLERNDKNYFFEHKFLFKGELDDPITALGWTEPLD